MTGAPVVDAGAVDAGAADVGAFTSRRTLVARRFARNRLAVAALATLVILFIGCYALPPLLPYSYSELDFNALQSPPSPEHWFGTNALGQDILAQVLRGMQKSMLIGVCVAVISTLIAATVGAIAGYFGGWRDRALMWIVDLLLVVPSFILIAIITPRTKNSANIALLIVLLAGFSWMISSRMVRGLTMSLREREYVQAARYMGVPNRTIIARHILPNVASPIIVQATLVISNLILLESSLSFLGLGIQPPTASLGSMVGQGRDYMASASWIVAAPALLIVGVALVVLLIGDWLRDTLDVRLAD